MNNAVLDEAANIFSGGELSLTERSLLVIGGLALAAVAIQPRPNKLLSLAALVAGAGLAIRGATGGSGAAAITDGRGSGR
jgi:hypothetical protein